MKRQWFTRARRTAVLLAACVGAVSVACLNPRPEDDPSLIDQGPAGDPGQFPGAGGAASETPIDSDDGAGGPTSGAAGSSAPPAGEAEPDAGAARDSAPRDAGADAGSDASAPADASAP